jgi:protein O-GlcNAc transferase
MTKIDSEQAWYGYAFSQWQAGNYEESIMAYRQLISISPQHTEGLMAAGESCYKYKRFWDAYSFYKRYMDIFPFKRKEMLPRIIMCLQWAEQEQSNNMDIKVELVKCLEEAGIKDQAQEMRLKAVHSNPREYCKLYPDDAIALAVKITHQIKVCQWDNYDTDVAHLRQLVKDGQACDPVFNTFGTTQEEQYVNTMRFVKWKYPNILPYEPTKEINLSRIRIAYISSDFHEHATAFLMAGLFEFHDKERFEVIVYSTGPDDGSKTRQRIKDATKFKDISKMSVEAAVEMIRNDEIDILIDLKGWCQGHVMDIVAQRPAKVLVHYLGWPGTTGICDYILADPVVIPENENKWFSEEVIYLPGSYQINDNQFLSVPMRKEDYGFKETDVIYACFNQAYKITPPSGKNG